MEVQRKYFAEVQFVILRQDFFPFSDSAERRWQLWLMWWDLAGNPFFKLKNGTNPGLVSQETCWV